MKFFVYLLILANVVFFLWETGWRSSSGDGSHQELAIPTGLEKIVLTSEVANPEAGEPEPGDADLQAAEADANPVTEDAPTPEPKPTPRTDCFLVGPEPDKARTEELMGLIKSHGIDSSLESKPGETPDGWWVLFPKAANLTAARENRRVLAEKGVHDMWVFEKGSLQWGISLGLYSERDKAEQARAQFAEKNIVTEVVPRLVQGQVYWLRIPWKHPPLELEEVIQLLNSQDVGTKIPAPVPCP